MQQEDFDKTSYLELDKWKPLEVFLNAHPHFKEGQMRWLLRHRKRNGLEDAIRKIGRNIYIHEGLFAEWILNKSE